MLTVFIRLIVILSPFDFRSVVIIMTQFYAKNNSFGIFLQKILIFMNNLCNPRMVESPLQNRSGRAMLHVELHLERVDHEIFRPVSRCGFPAPPPRVSGGGDSDFWWSTPSEPPETAGA